MQGLLGDAWPLLEAALQSSPPVSIRFNPSKAVDRVYWPEVSASVPWHPDGHYLKQRPVFTLDPMLHAGAYYVQEASSMFVYEALRQHRPEGPLRVLDLCAAPGGKSTLLAAMLGPDDLLLSNEVIRQRTGPLRENLERWGISNLAVANADSEDFTALEGYFDVILTDAPCSGEGLFRKDPDAIKEWSLPNVELCAGRQRRILAAAVQALKPGGLLLYSTCTYNAMEDEDNAHWLQTQFDLQALTIQTPPEWGIEGNGANGYHFYPHKLAGEGFYLAAFRKAAGEIPKRNTPAHFAKLKALPKAQLAQLPPVFRDSSALNFYLTPTEEIIALPKHLETDFLILDKVLKNKWFGVLAGTFKGRDFIPAHGLAMSLEISAALPALELSREDALRFLKKETFDLPSGAANGWTLARFAGLNLGWMKVLPNRMNNYLPQERRIRMEI